MIADSPCIKPPTLLFVLRRSHSRTAAPLLNCNCFSPLTQKILRPDFTPAQNAALNVAQAGDFDRLKELLEGPDVIKDSNMLSSALREKRLLGNDNHDRISLEYLFMTAASIGHTEMLRYLLGLYPYPGPFIPDRVLRNAINSGSTEIVQVLLDLDPPVVLNHHLKKTAKPLDHALWLDRRQDTLRMTEFLLEHGADPNFGGSSKIYGVLSHMEYAILSSWPELVQLLVRYVYVVTL
jgi:ankyrin repeat protein